MHPLFIKIIAMDQNKLEKLEKIKNYLENEDVAGLSKYVERIGPGVKNDEDFQDIFVELNGKNYDQALFITEDIILSIDDHDLEDDYDKMDLEEFNDFNEKDDFVLEDPEEDFDDFNEEQFDDDLSFFEEKDDDYF